jgi:hypothetical protein
VQHPLALAALAPSPASGEREAPSFQPPLRRALGAVHHARVQAGAVRASDAFPGRVFKLSLDGKVLGVLGESGKQLKQFGWIHEIACPSENVLYVAELLNWRVQKLVLHPKK